MRIPQLAIHLDRGVNDEGLRLDKQQHPTPVWSVAIRGIDVLDHVAAALAVWQRALRLRLRAYDTAAPAIFGPHQEFLAAGRLDNLSGVHAGSVRAASTPAETDSRARRIRPRGGRQRDPRPGLGPLPGRCAGRISRGLGAAAPTSDTGRTGPSRSASRSTPVTPFTRTTASARSGQPTAAQFGARCSRSTPTSGTRPTARVPRSWRRACRARGVTYQEFVSNNAIPCGSTIGPLTATRLGHPHHRRRPAAAVDALRARAGRHRGPARSCPRDAALPHRGD